MEFKEGKCPKCGGLMQVPENLEQLACMYCGKGIEVGDIIPVKHVEEDRIKHMEEEVVALWQKRDAAVYEKAETLLQEDLFNYTANYILGLNALPNLLIDNKVLMKKFRAKLYEEAMIAYIETYRPSLEYIERACVARKQETDRILTECAGYFVQAAAADMKKDGKKKEVSSGVQEEYRVLLALFAIPMILELHLDISEELTDKLIEAWRERFPKGVIKKGTFEQINGGFRKKGFCYITTAVCETLHKSDDCYELEMFRAFRDHYLLQQEDGENLIKEYYKMAPVIVENINSLEDCRKIYLKIWRNYLKGCLYAIEAGDQEGCRQNYCRMVRDLQKKYYM